MLPRGLVTALTVLITLAWTFNVAVGFIDPARHNAEINAIFAIVVGAVYALGKQKPTSHETADNDTHQDAA